MGLDESRAAHTPRLARAMVAERRCGMDNPAAAVSWCDAIMTSMSSVPRASSRSASTCGSHRKEWVRAEILNGLCLISIQAGMFEFCSFGVCSLESREITEIEENEQAKAATGPHHSRQRRGKGVRLMLKQRETNRSNQSKRRGHPHPDKKGAREASR